ncbi:MAG: efflux RND transporter periplasmic adaptor subunit [Burkholderiaceae bacterium]|nr:efflux RND transporter periplasmic adaptor subunit [Burkholderiaceae bacterium]
MSLLAWLRATGFATASLMLAAQGLPPAAAQSPKGTGANAAGTGANAAGTGTALPAAAAPSPSPANALSLSRDQQVALGVRLAAISAAVPPRLSLPGVVVVPPELQQVIAAAVPGLLTDVRVAVGDRVQAGQVLARISSPQLVELQHALASAITQRELARDTFERDQRLFGEGLIAQVRLRASQASLAQADAQLAERRLQLRLAGMPEAPAPGAALRAQATIVAPTAGIVIEAGAANGQRVDAATALFRIARGSQVWLELQAPPERAAAIAIGDPVEWPQRGVQARVSAIGSAVNSGQTVTIRARLDAGADRVRPGETVQAQVRLRLPARAQWRVPAAALAQLQGRSVVFAGQGESFRVVRAIEHGRDDDGVMVEAALVATDRVVVSGVPGLKALASEAQP